MAKPRAVILGGKQFNVSKQLHRYFDVVHHFHQDSKLTGGPPCDILLVIRDFVSHGHIRQAMEQYPGVPIVAAKVGWSHMYKELERRGLLPQPEDEQPAVVEAAEVDAVPDEPALPVEQQITDDELEKLTMPDKELVDRLAVSPPMLVNGAGAVAIGAAAVEVREKKEPVEFTDDPSVPPALAPAWEAHLARWASNWSEQLGKGVMQVIQFTAAHPNPAPEDFLKLSDDPDTAWELYGSFNRSRGLFRSRNGLSPVRPRKGAVVPQDETSKPVFANNIVSNDVERFMQEWLALGKKRQDLMQKQVEIEQQIKDVEKQLEIYKPLAAQLQALNQAVNTVKERIARASHGR